MTTMTIVIGWKSQEHGHACAAVWKHVAKVNAVGVALHTARVYAERNYPAGSWVVRVFQKSDPLMLLATRAQIAEQTGATIPEKV